MGLGDALSIGSALAWAVAVIIHKRLGETLPPLPLNFIKSSLVLGMLAATALALRSPVPRFDGPRWAVVLLSGVLGMAAADSPYFAALNLLGASRAGILGNLYSPFVILLSVLFLGEAMRPLQWFGFALVSAGMLVVGHAKGQAAGVTPADVRRGFLLGASAIFLMAAAIVMIKPVLAGQPVVWIVLARTLGGLFGVPVPFALSRKSPWSALRRRRLRWPMLVAAAFMGQYVALPLWVGGYK